MAAKSENIFVRAKAYQGNHPRTSWANCIQACKGKKRVSGVKAKPKAKPEKRASSRDSTRATTRNHDTKTATVTISGARKKKKAAPVRVATTRAKGDVISRSQKLINEIDRLEAKRANQNTKVMKDIVQLVINKKENELRYIMQILKKRG